ncbi:MAG: chemotaxis protein CheW [Alphaproteobacteria bacterium]|nr:chemotaxis protein CheW [Alphaproteobacteria bacterium]
MSQELVTTSKVGDTDHETGNEEFVTITIGEQWFGVPVLTVQDVLVAQKITSIPLAPPEVAGALNLRGRIVTAIDVRQRLRLPQRDPDQHSMSVVVDHGGELYSLIVDSVGEVLGLNKADFERNPSTLDAVWREVSAGVYQLEGKLLLILDVERLLDIQVAKAA